MIQKFKINHVLQVSLAQNIPKSSTPSSTASTTTTLSPLLKRHLSMECLNTPVTNLKLDVSCDASHVYSK
jgi:hypothetical protein